MARARPDPRATTHPERSDGSHAVAAPRHATRAARSIVALLASIVLTSCTVRSGHELVVWAMGSEGEAVAKLVPAFTRDHPDIRVRVQSIPWSAAHEKLLTAFVGESLPDVFQAGNTWLPELRELGAIDAIDARLDASGTLARADFFPGVLDTNVLEGQTWGVPWYVDTRVLFYRNDLLAEVGIREAPATWDAWLAAMEAVQSHARAREAHAVLLPLREWQVPVILALGLNATLLRDDDGYGNFRSEPVREAFERYLEIFHRGLAASDSAATSGNVYQDFARGAFVFYVTGPWNLGEMNRRLPDTLANAWSTAPMPSVRDGVAGVSLAGGASLVLSSSSRRKDDAWRLIEYLAAPSQQAALERETGDLPACRSAWQALGLADEARTRAFFTQLQSVRATPKIPEWEQIASQIARHAEAMIRGDETLDEGLAALDRDADRILEKRRWLATRSRVAAPHVD